MLKHKYRNKKCRVCKIEFTAFSSTTLVCSIECAIKYNEEKNEKKEKRRKAAIVKEARAALKRMDEQKLSYWLPKAQYWFNKFIRMRDENKTCVSGSGARKCSGQRHAGHYRSVGSAPHLRFDERNCHGQCAICNNHLSGNLIAYRTELVRRIGVEAVEALESDNKPKKYTIDDVKQIMKYYKAKCKDMEVF